MQKAKRILALLLVAALTVTQLPVTALATSAGEGGEIIAFDTLPEETANQTVTLGTSLEDLNLPNTLIATVRVVAEADTEASEPDNETVLDSGEPQQEELSDPVANADSGGESNPELNGEQSKPEPGKPETMEINIPIPVKWVSSPDYDGEKIGTYIFTAQVDGFTVSTELPSITVTVGEVTGMVTTFDELPDSIRWQNTSAPMFPETVSGTVYGKYTEIPVTWQADHTYNVSNPAQGLYVFDAVLGEDYTLADGAIAPRITVYISQTVSRFAPFRMGGDGTEASPLEITTADQLAEIAVLVNAGRLESFLLNGVGNVSLRLMNDLDLSAYGQDYNGGKGWQPIGGYINNKVMPFKGNFDGNGYTISGLYINDSSRDYVGLFGMIESATVQNLNLTAVSVSAKSNVGSIIGNASGSGEITTCRVSGSVSGVSNVGGIIGSTYSMTPKYSMSCCSFEGSVSGDINVYGNLIGGLAGTAKDLTILHSYASAAVSGNENVGGLVGKLEGGNGKLQNCYAIGNVIGKSSVGGLAGLPYSSSIENCVALNSGVEATGTYGGRVTGQNYNGTLSGNAAFSSMVVTVSGSAKTVTSDAASVDGADVAAADLKADGNIGGRFTATNGWTVENGKLPGFGAAVNMPEYITDGSDPNFPGEGTEESPFLIGTAEKLAKLAELVNAGNTSYNAKYYKLIADIDLSNYGASNTDFNSGKGWVPIGNNINKFMGSFDGNGKTIIRLYIDDIGRDYVGLFGYIKENSAVIHNLTVKDASIDAGGSTGGIVGRAEGGARINHCSVNGTVTGSGNIGGVVGFLHEASMDQCGADVAVSGSTIGGVVGKVEKNSSVINCYAIGSITDKGGNYDLYSYMGVGGVAGSVNGGSTVENCYSTDSINSTSTGSVYVAGVVGYVSGSTVKNCAALNTSISGSYNAFLVRVGGCSNKLSSTFSDNIAFNGVSCTITSSDIDYNGTDKTADELQSAGGFPSAFTTDPWTYVPGKLPGLFGKTVAMPVHITAKLTSYFAGGTGSYSNPYQITTAAQLAKLAELVNAGNTGYNDKDYKLMNDLDLSGYGKNYDSGKGWKPIGTKANPFKGYFDGNGKVISGLYINRPDEDYIGLFGYIGHTVIDYMPEPGSVRKLGIVNATITGKDFVGGLLGQYGSGAAMFTTVNNYVTGRIIGNNNVGGLAGYIDWTHMAGCYSTANVTGIDSVGGLLGYSKDSNVKSCYATGSVTGNDKVGGLIGEGASADNCVTLNPSINGSTVNIGRIAGTISSHNLSNYAFSGMKVNGSTLSSADSKSKDGVDITLAQANTAAFWGSGWGSNGWILTDGKLPILAGFPAGAQSGDGGVYLTERDIANATVEITGRPFTYTGSPIAPALTVIFDGETLVKGTDYIMEVAAGSASNGINAGTVTAKLVGQGNFKGEKTGLSYTIQPKPLTDDMLTTTEFSYTGKAQKPALTDGAKTLVEDVDYTASYTNNTNAGTAYMSITGKGNYSGALNRIFTIAKAPLTITGGTVAEKTYNGTNTASVTGVSFGGLQNSETLSLNDDYTIAGAQFDSADAGTDKIVTATLTLINTDTTKNYALASANISLTNQVIKKAAAPTGVNQTLDVLTNHAQEYDFEMTTLLPTLGSPKSLGTVEYALKSVTDIDNIIGNPYVYNKNMISIPVYAVATTGKTATITVTVKSTNYADFDATITVKTIDAITLTVTGLTVESKIYDGTNAATLRGTAALDTTNVQGGDEVTLAGTPSAVFDNANAGSNKIVTITGLSLIGKDAAKYRLDLSGVTGTIAAKPLTEAMLTVTGGPFTYTGTAHTPAVSVKDGGETLAADTDYAVAYSNNINAGTATVTITGKGNYSGTPSKTFTIAPKLVTITPDSGQSKAYDEADPMLTYTVSPMLFTGDGFTGALSRTSGEDVGDYAITLGTLSAGNNYTLSLSSPTVNFSITKKPVTITPTSGRLKYYGSDDPVLPFANDGGLPAAAFTGKLSREPGENVGDYIITLGTLSVGNNYTLSLSSTPVTFSIKPANVTITPKSGQNKVYGASDPTLGYTVFPSLVNGDSLSGELSREPGENVGDYKITLGTLSAGSNYSLFLYYQSVNFSITPKVVTITPAANQSKVYGALDPVLSFANDGGLPATAFTGKLSRAAGENVGNYVINLGDLTAGNNYTLSLSSPPVNFGITKKSVTVTPSGGQSKIYGAIDPTLVFTNNGGLAPSDFTGALSRATGENVGDYAITLGTLRAGDNYELSLDSGAPKFTIEQAAVQSINTIVSNVSKTAYEVRNATTAQAVVTAADLPANVSITTDSGAVATLPITWSTTTSYNAKGTTYQVIGILTGNANIDAGSVTKSVTVTVTPITAVNPVFGDTTVLVNFHGGSATASALETANILRTSGSISVQGEDITYAISWSGGPLDTTSAGNSATFTGTISYPGTPAWLTLPSNFTVSRKVTVTAKTAVTISGISTPNKTYDGAAYVPSGTVSVSGDSVPASELVWLYTSTDGGSYSSTAAPTNAGAYKLTISVPDSNENYTGSEAFTFTIEKRQITLTADNKSVIKGSSLPELTYTVGNLAPGKTKADALSAEPTLACPTFVSDAVGSYAITLTGGTATDNYSITARIDGTLTVAEQTYTVTFNLNGGTRTGGGELTQTVAKGSAATAPTVSRSSYTFTGWDKSFDNVTADLAVTASWSYNGGGSSGGGDSYTPSTPAITTPAKKPDQPVTAAASVTATAGANGVANAAIPDKAITDAIAKAQADARTQGKTANGISVGLNVTMPQGTTSFTATLSRNSLNSLVSAGVSSLTLAGSPVDVSFDLKALEEIQKQSSGDISITIAPATGLSKEAKALLGNRPVYSITISYVKDGKTVNVTSLDSGTATLSIPYTPGKNEAVGYLFGVYVDAKGKAQRISGSVYDVNSRSLLIPTGHFSVYGVGYTAPIAKFTDIDNHWGKEAIDYVVGRGLLSGTSETTFAPNTAMTRGMLVTALGRLAGVDTKAYTTNSFTDVKADSAFRPYIEWAYKKGVVQGIGNQQFAPDRAITREEIAVIFANYAKATGYKLPVTREATAYADASSIGSVYKTAVTAMQQAGIMMGGTDNRFNPKSNATRAEVSSMLHRYVKLTIDPATAQGWALNDDGRYMYYKDGKPLTGWQTIDGKKYYFYNIGVLQTGWVKDGNNWRYYSGNKALTGWWDIGSETSKKRYYFDVNAIMVSGKWLQIDGKWYYFYSDGSLARDTKIDGYEVGPDGVRKTK